MYAALPFTFVHLYNNNCVFIQCIKLQDMYNKALGH